MGSTVEPLVTALATAIVRVLATDAWPRAVEAVEESLLPSPSLVADDPSGPRRYMGDRVSSELRHTRDRLAHASEQRQRAVTDGCVDEWTYLLSRLLAADPGLEDLMRWLLDRKLAPLLPAAERARVERTGMTARPGSGITITGDALIGGVHQIINRDQVRET
jgi:hypothetical protein